MEHPVSNIQWLDVNLLDANDWNPNYVQGPEMKLLAFSLRKQGWIQPILVCPQPGTDRCTIIDGFHRHLVTKTDKNVWAMTGGKVPVVLMNLTEAERMLLTIRINRAKGSHEAFKMHEIITKVVHEHGLSVAEVCAEIGADANEVETLLMRDVFEKKEVDKYNYSKAWVPPGTERKSWGMEVPQSIAVEGAPA